MTYFNTLGFNSQKLTFFRILEISCQSHDSEHAVAMVDSATHGRPISIGRAAAANGRMHSRVISGPGPVPVDTCAVPRETHPPACLPADLARLTCQQVTRSSNAFNGLQGHAGSHTQRDLSGR